MSIGCTGSERSACPRPRGGRSGALHEGWVDYYHETASSLANISNQPAYDNAKCDCFIVISGSRPSGDETGTAWWCTIGGPLRIHVGVGAARRCHEFFFVVIVIVAIIIILDIDALPPCASSEKHSNSC